YFYFFFSSRRRHTRLQGDWSSDVCSSDLILARRQQVAVNLKAHVLPAESELVKHLRISLGREDVGGLRRHAQLSRHLGRNDMRRSEERRVGKECISCDARDIKKLIDYYK